MKKMFIVSILFFISVFVYSQNTLIGAFSGIVNQQIKLLGFSGFNTYTIDSIQTNGKGEFKLSYGEKDYGIAYLSTEDNQQFVVVLGRETIMLNGETFALPETVKILEGRENQLFIQYATEHPRREQALSAWDYLEKKYTKDSLFAEQAIPKQAIANEKQRIKAEDSLFLDNLPQDSYLSFYLPLRKLVSSVATIAQYRPEEIPAALSSFRKIDYASPRLYKSGLLSDVIESHFWLIENSARSLDSAYIEMNKSIDLFLESLLGNEKKLNEQTQNLFNLLEKRSLFSASEYLALKVLTQTSCSVNEKLAKQLESYRTMKKGNIAPDIIFTGDVVENGEYTNNYNRLADIESDYKLLIFGASWCEKCVEELILVDKFYEKWKLKGVEVVFVSLDTDRTLFKQFTSVFSFLSVCDYLKWDSQSAKDYHVFASPTMFLLDQDHKILVRPISVEHANTWVEYKIK